MPEFTPRIPPVPPTITGDLRTYLEAVRRQLNGEAYISKFSGTNPNTSGITGVPGDLVLNVGSASTFSRLWVKGGADASASTLSWSIVRIAR